MSDAKPNPGDSKPSPASKDSGSGFFGKLKGLFSPSSPKVPSSKPAKALKPSPKKGESSFLKNFKVKDVQSKEPSSSEETSVEAPKVAAPSWSKHLEEESKPAPKPTAPLPPQAAPGAPSKPSLTAPSPAGKPLPTPYTGKSGNPVPSSQPPRKPQSTSGGSGKDDEPANKQAPSDMFSGKDPFFPAGQPKPEPKAIEKPSASKSPAQMMLPKAVSGPLSPTAKPSFPAPPSPGLPKPPHAAPKPSEDSAGKAEDPAKATSPKPLSTPPAKPSGNLLPGQKHGDDVGISQGETQILRTPQTGSTTTQPTSLPSLTVKPPEPKAAAKPAIVKKPEKPEQPDSKAKPAPGTRRTSTGTLKKESLRLKALPSGNFKPMAAGTASKGEPKATSAAASNQEPEFKSPAIPLNKPLDKPKESAPAKPPVAPKGVPAAAKPSGAVKVPAAKLQAKPQADSKAQPKAPSEPKAKAAVPPGSPSPPASQKKKPKVVLPPRREESNRKSPLLLLIPFGILLLAGIAFAFYWSQRQTSVEVTVKAGELTLRGEAIVVMNFAGKLQMVRDDYFRRRAPLEEEIDLIKANLAAAQGDLAGRVQRKKLLDDALEQYQAEIPQFLNESQQALNSLWDDQSAALANEYDEFKESLHQEIISRAEELGVDYQRNTEIDAIAVAVNAFRLALYGVARDTDVSVSEQRAWAEDILQRWNAYEKEWRERQTEIKTKALEIKKQPLPKIAETRKRIDNLEREISAVEIDLQSLRDEVARHEENLKQATQRLGDVDDPFFLELQSIPKEFEVARFPVDSNGVIRMPHLNEREDLNQGTHFLLVRAVKDEAEYWAVDEFEILPYQSVDSTIQNDQFIPLRQILEEGTFMKP